MKDFNWAECIGEFLGNIIIGLAVALIFYYCIGWIVPDIISGLASNKFIQVSFDVLSIRKAFSYPRILGIVYAIKLFVNYLK